MSSHGPPPARPREASAPKADLSGPRDVVVVFGEQVVVDGDEAVRARHVLAPAVVVEAAEVAGDHEVRGDRLVGAAGLDGRGLGAEELEQRVGGEAAVVEDEARVRGLGADPRGQDLRPVAVGLGPERGAPRAVEAVEVAVALLEPGAEGGGGVVAVAGAVVLVADMPHREGGVVRVALGEPGRHLDDGFLEDRRVRAVFGARARVQGEAFGVDREGLGVGLGEPRRRGRGGGRQVGLDAACGEEVHDGVELREVPLPRTGVDARPGEDVDGDDVDPGIAHEADVLRPTAHRVGGRVATARGCSRRRRRGRRRWE